MLKSDLINHLQNNLNKHGDGEIQVELVSDLNENGKVYPIEDVTNAVGFNFEADYITVIDSNLRSENKFDIGDIPVCTKDLTTNDVNEAINNYKEWLFK